MLSGFERLDIAKPSDTKGQITEPSLPPTRSCRDGKRGGGGVGEKTGKREKERMKERGENRRKQAIMALLIC